MRPTILMLVGGGLLALGGLLAALRARGVAIMGGQPKTSTQAGVTTGRVYVRDGALYGPGTRYQLAQTDLLWLGRALLGETGGSDVRAMSAVAWCLAQNWLLVQRSVSFPTFADLIRAYSQPVSAAWADPNSEKCRDNPDACTASRIARRREIQSTPWSSLPLNVRGVVTAFAEGELSNPVPEMVDFAAYRFDGATSQIGGNWFGVGSGRRVV